MNFRYVRDPLCLTACAAYSINRLLIKPHCASGFWHDHANDLLLIPAALPWLLWAQRKLRLRQNDAFPNWAEITLHLLVWSVLFEGIGPHVMNVTGDWVDVAAYTVGALLAGTWWHWRSRGDMFS